MELTNPQDISEVWACSRWFALGLPRATTPQDEGLGAGTTVGRGRLDTLRDKCRFENVGQNRKNSWWWKNSWWRSCKEAAFGL